MNHVLAIARKELRAYFLSPVALIFLLMFLFVTLFWFTVGALLYTFLIDF